MDDLTKCGAGLLEFKALSAPGEFEGYASTFGGEPDSHGDVIAAGAFAASLAMHAAKGTKPKLFWQHDRDQPIGQWLEMKEDEKGLYVKGRVNMNVQRGREAYELCKAGDIDGLSIGYRLFPGGLVADPSGEFYTLTAIDLREVSIVSIGSNEGATIAGVKSARQTHALIEKLRAGDRLSEREFEQMAKGALGLSNSQAERAARVHLKGQGEPVETAAKDGDAFLRALVAG